jgi:hypothetical protein
MHANRARLMAVGVMVALAGSALVSCAKPNAESCDGGIPVATLEEAVRGLLAASESGDFDAACAVITNRPSEQDMATALESLKGQSESIGITSSTAAIKEREQGGSLIPVEISNGESSTKIKLDVMKIRDEGYRVMWP